MDELWHHPDHHEGLGVKRIKTAPVFNMGPSVSFSLLPHSQLSFPHVVAVKAPCLPVPGPRLSLGLSAELLRATEGEE